MECSDMEATEAASELRSTHFSYVSDSYLEGSTS